jgi:hypothetical protein
MKLKNLLILTLFISINYSVYSEDKKLTIKEYTLYEELNTILNNYSKSTEETNEIRRRLRELFEGPNSQNFINFDNLLAICVDLHAIKMRADNLMACLRYEKVIYQQNISNKLLIITHSINREYFFSNLESSIKLNVDAIKKRRIKIQNTTAVIAINKNLEQLSKIKEWVLINKNKPVLK